MFLLSPISEIYWNIPHQSSPYLYFSDIHLSSIIFPNPLRPILLTLRHSNIESGVINFPRRLPKYLCSWHTPVLIRNYLQRVQNQSVDFSILKKDTCSHLLCVYYTPNNTIKRDLYSCLESNLPSIKTIFSVSNKEKKKRIWMGRYRFNEFYY